MSSQIMQESGWGQKQSGKNNYFGIKAKKVEPYTSVLATEEINGKKIKLNQNFRDYESFEEGISSYIDLLINNYDILNHGTSINNSSKLVSLNAGDVVYLYEINNYYN